MSQKTLQLSHKLLTLFTTTRESNQIVTLPTSWGYIRSLEWARIISLTSAAASTTPLQDLPSPPPLLLLLDIPWPDLKSLFLFHLARVHQEDCSSFTHKPTSPLKNVLANARLTRKLTSPLKNVLASAPLTFTCKSTSPLKNVLANAPLTFTHKSTHSQERAFKCTFDFQSCRLINSLSIIPQKDLIIKSSFINIYVYDCHVKATVWI